MNPEPDRSATRRIGSFRQALLATGVLTLLALVAMAALLVVGLARADGYLDRLRRSRDQLAMVTQLQADVERLRIDSTADPRSLANDIRSIETVLRAYHASAREEVAAEPEDFDEGEEVADADAVVAAFAAVRGSLLRGSPSAEEAAARRRFEAMTRRVVTREAMEAREAGESMAELRRTVTVVAVLLPTLVGLVGAAGAWLILAQVAGPLRRLQAAARTPGDSPVDVGGFSEFRRLGDAFARMQGEIAAQQATLEAANAGLEAEVAERTSEIEASRAALAEVDANRRLFFAQVGHELRTPATVIRGEAEVALRDPAATPERLREALATVAANTQVLERRLADLIALARAEDGRVTLRREPVDLACVARQAAALAEPYVRANGLTLTAGVDDGPTPQVDGDASWLQQAILAIVDNAAKFADDREPIRLRLDRASPDRARLTVADSGPGVDACDLPRLFDRWYQTAGGAARGGSGLGLSVARWVVEQHGGEIRAHSAPGKGLMVEIELPVTSWGAAA